MTLLSKIEICLYSCFIYLKIAVSNPINIANPTTITIGIQIGEVTHHHDHLATGPISANLSTRNIRNTVVPIPIPELLFDSAILIYF
jgi:hypothetical protein